MKLADRIFPKAKDFAAFAPPDGELPRKAFAFVWIFIKVLRWPIALTVLATIVNSVCWMLEPYFLGRIVETASTSPPDEIWHLIIRLIAIYLFVSQILGRVLSQFEHRCKIHFLPILIVIVQRRLAQYLFTHSYRYFQDDYAGRLAGKVVEMPQATRDIMDTLLEAGVFFVTNFITATIIFTSVKWYFGLCMVALFMASALLCRWRVPKVAAKAETAAAAMQLMRGRYIDSITNILLVKLFGHERHEDRIFSKSLAAVSSAAQSQGFQELYLWRGQHIISGVFQTAVLLLAIEGYRHGDLTIGQVTTVVTLALSLASRLWWMLGSMILLFNKFATIHDALDTIVQPTEVRDLKRPTPLPLPRADIAFDHVTFGYGAQPIFDDFVLHIPQGQRVGLVGPSGAGKSTLVQLVLRLFDVQEGVIKIGGQDIAHVPQNDLRHAIAMIPQATDLLHRSIRDNIAYGNLDASEDQIIDAAKKAFIHDTILGLKDSHGNYGYDALVGERGVKLSGGQRQRIAIARAFLKNAPILILDEATSALDSESERLIQQSLNELFQGRTVLAIAHRLSTIAHLDRIVVLEEGRIVEDGPHATLVNAGGLYARLWQLQSEGFIGETP